jgi:WD40 repeat protein
LLYEALRGGEFCYVLNARQTGKSSLRVQIKSRLQAQGYQCAAVDMTSIGSETLTPLQWYKGLIAELWRGFSLGPIVPFKAWWQEQAGLSLIQCLQRFLEDVLLVRIPGKIVIFIDEIDSILSLPFSVDDFFAFVRFCYDHRADNPEYDRFTFALFGVATPSDLIRAHSRTPFNIGKAINLNNFSLHEALPLAQGLVGKTQHPEAILKAVLGWTGGQPFLTQKLCQRIFEACQQAPHECWNIPQGQEEQMVEQLVRAFLILDWEQQDEPEHLKTIRDRLLQNEQRSGRLLGLYQQILQGEGVATDDSQEQMELLLSGLVVRHQGTLQIKCRLYQEVFNLSWIRQQLNDLRPYAQNFSIWTSNPSDESRLLRGQALADAQAWASGKSLSDQDYRFLAAGEAVDRREAQKALEASRTQEIEARLALEERNNQQQRRLILALTGSLLVAVVLGVATFTQYRQVASNRRMATLSEIKAVMISSNALFQPERPLDALVEAIRAKQLLEAVKTAPGDLSTSVDQALRQAVYKAVERNRFSYGAEVRGVDFSPDGQVIASVGNDGTIKLWRFDGKLLAAVSESQNQDGIFGVKFSPQGDRIAVANGNGTVQLLSRQGQLLQTLKAHRGAAHAVAFSPDGQVLASVGADQTLRLWNRQGLLLKTLTGHSGEVWGVAFSPDGQLVATGSRDRSVKLWRVADGQLLTTLTGFGGAVRAVAFNVRGQVLATGSDDGTVRLWRRDGTLLTNFKGHDAAVQAITFSPDGQTFATASWDNTVKIWSPDGILLRTLQSHSDRVWTLAFSSNSLILASGSWDRTIRLWQLGKTIITPLVGHTATVLGVAVSPDGSTVASASDDHTVRLWSIDGKALATLKGHAGEVYDVAFSPDGRQLASGSLDRSIKLWNRQGELLATLKEHQAEVWGVAFSPNSQMLVSGSYDSTVRLWRAQDGKSLRILTGHQGRVYRVAFSPDGQKVASASDDRTARLWGVDGKLIHIFTGHQGAVLGVRFSSDGQMLATTSADKTVKLWRPDGTLLHTLIGHQAEVLNVAFSGDGQLLATASADGTIKLWRRDGTMLVTLRGHRGRVWSVAFDLNDQKMISGGEDKMVIIWDLKLILSADQVMAYACHWVRDYLRTNQDVAASDRQLCKP